MPVYTITHMTRYTYANPVIDCTNQLMLYPLADAQCTVHAHRLTISGDPVIETFVDYFGNRIGVFSLIKPHSELLIRSEVQVETRPVMLPDDQDAPASQWEMLEEFRDRAAFLDFCQSSAFGSSAEVLQTVSAITSRDKTPYQNAMLLMEFMYRNFAYMKGVTSIETELETIWGMMAGVCQDFAHMLLCLLRMTGIPARYVSGYICPKDTEMRGEGATHAWTEAWLPHYGWIGLDPTNNCIADEHHVRLATGRSFSDCTPVKGTYKGSGAHRLEVYVEIQYGAASVEDKPIRLPNFTYEAERHAPAPVQNSYRNFLEVQQRQQQQ
jgi:transglutaminase-like putative cysteine protease